MSEAEAIELVGVHTGNLGLSISLYLSITFAYLVVAHTAGATLTRFQTTVISSIYVLAAFMTWGGMIISQLWMGKLMEESSLNLPGTTLGWVMHMKFWQITLGILVAAGIAVSLYYLRDIRVRGRDRENLDN
jgi:hypothetical protein